MQLLETLLAALGLRQEEIRDLDLAAATATACAALVLPASLAAIFLLYESPIPEDRVNRMVRDMALIIVGWIIFAVLSSPQGYRGRSAKIAENMVISSRWITVTTFFVFVAWNLFPVQESLRTAMVVPLLLLLIPFDIYKTCFRWRRKVVLIVVLLVTNCILAWRSVERVF